MATTISKDNIILYGDGGPQINNAALLLFDDVKPEYDWVDANLCGELYHLCGKTLFENADGIKFYIWLNVRAKSELIPNPWAKSQIKYLIFRLSSLINLNNKFGKECFHESIVEEVNSWEPVFQKILYYGKMSSKDDYLRKSWEIRVSELCGISHSDMTKHRHSFCQSMTKKDSNRAKEKQRFIEDLNRILTKYEELLFEDDDS